MTTVTISGGGQTITTTVAAMVAAADRLPPTRAGARAPARTSNPTSPRRSQPMAGPDTTEDKGSIAAQELRLFVERVERLREEIKGLNDDVSEVYKEMKGRGYDIKIVKKLLTIRQKKKGEHEEESLILETYMSALGMI
ncbi:DUF2312 domain-containing protein [Rhizorhabdus histidinilytica]|uniref:DUF2312 domain-containing protein n=1 Tax=Rhizorhabdus histidinilytica TaxID=439228 RepID=UPI001F24BA5E|nr:DUF2312 domain-containing protein [Rhizorhabdus histidinilytica]